MPDHPDLGHVLGLQEAGRLAEALGAPVYQQTVPCAAHFPSEHPTFMGALSRRQEQVLRIVESHDLMICLGTDVLRLSVQSPIDPLPESTDVIQTGLRDWEMGKNYSAELAVRADVKNTLQALVPFVQEKCSPERESRVRASLELLKTRNWSSQRVQKRERLLESADPDASPMDPALLMSHLAETLPEHAVVLDEGLVSTRPLLDFLPPRDA